MTFRIRTLAATITSLSVAGAFTSASIGAFPASAQDNTDYKAIVTIMQACAQIDDLNARVTCYDNNIGRKQSAATEPRADSNTAAASSSSTPHPAEPASSRGFGADTLPQARTPEDAAQIEAKITSITRRAPGIYAFTLEDGGEWQFTEAAPTYYDPPRVGSTVKIERASLGSFMMRFANQPSVRLRRIR